MHQHRVQPTRLGDACHHRRQVQEAIRHVEGDDAVGLQMPLVHRHRLGGDQVDRHRVAGERVHCEHIEVLRRLALQRQPRIAKHTLDARRAVFQKAEFAIGQLEHLRVDFINAIGVASAPVGCERAGTQADEADPARRIGRRRDGAADARRFAVVRGRLTSARCGQELLAVFDRAVVHLPHVVVRIVPARIERDQRAVEVTQQAARIGRVVANLHR